jgi:hypothetical protein
MCMRNDGYGKKGNLCVWETTDMGRRVTYVYEKRRIWEEG